MKAFLDTDVIISSLISKTGAANYILNSPDINSAVSNIALPEIHDVAKRLKIPKDRLRQLIGGRINVVNVKLNEGEIKKLYGKYTMDIDDAKIIGSAHKAKAKYLITYNLRHYKIDRIKEELDFAVLSPALFLQYLRSS